MSSFLKQYYKLRKYIGGRKRGKRLWLVGRGFVVVNRHVPMTRNDRARCMALTHAKYRIGTWGIGRI
jgi:hypothetical protein